MSTQPKALRLADALEDSLEDYSGSSLPRRCQDIADEAAAELRRLHAANVDCLEHFNALKAERDELLAALKSFPGVEHALPFNNLCTCGQCEFIRLRRAVIAKAEA